MEHIIKTNKQEEMINITDVFQEDVRNSKINDGLLIVFVPHTTAGITINENADPDVWFMIFKLINLGYIEGLSVTC